MKTEFHDCSNHNPDECSEAANCYSYILGRPDYYWSVPGMGFAHTKASHYKESFNDYFQSHSLEGFRQTIKLGAVNDGLISTDQSDAGEGYRLAVLYFPENDLDFHWYLKESDGSWSHKDGWRPVESVKHINSEFYSIFGGYYLIPSNGIVLKESFPLRKL